MQVNQESNLNNRIIALEREVRALRKSAGLASAIVGRGGLTLLNDGALRMLDTDDQERLFIGQTSAFEATAQSVFFVRDQNGALRLAMYDPQPATGGYQPVVWIFDHLGHIAFTTDINGGCAEPWIPVAGQNSAWPSTFLDIGDLYLTLPVSACTGVKVWEGWIGKVSHPKISYGGVFGRATGVSGSPTYTFKVNGVTVDTFSQTTLDSSVRGPFDISSLLGVSTIVAQLSVSATGTGTDRIAAQIRHCWLRQT